MEDKEEIDGIELIHSKETEAELRERGILVVGVKRGSEDECEKADMLICSLVRWGTGFTDNLIAACSVCNEPVFYRPHAPKTPKKMCLVCASIDLKKRFKKA